MFNRAKRVCAPRLRPGVPALMVLLVIWLLAPQAIRAQSTPLDYVVQVTSAVQASPAQVTLCWVANPIGTGFQVYRKALTVDNWGNPIATLPATATGYTDASVAVGTPYEYQVVREQGTSIYEYAYGYVATGIGLPLVENRGKVILLVELDTAATLTTELAQLNQDLVGDGWTVIRHDVDPNAAIADVQALVATDYAADPANVKSLFIFGHVPIPKSGWLIPDGHFYRPFPTDFYYSVIGGNWPCTNVNGPGVLDPSSLAQTTTNPEPVTLQTGRVDLWNLPSLDYYKDELERLRNYLDKDHNYRMHAYPIRQKGLLIDGWGMADGSGTAQNGWRNFTPFFGPTNFGPGDGSGDWWCDPAVTTPYLWAFGSSAGIYQGPNGMETTWEVPFNDPAIFTMTFGSYFDEWDYQDDYRGFDQNFPLK